MSDKPPTSKLHPIVAERAVLCCGLKGSPWFAEATAFLKKEDFCDDAHQRIYTAVLDQVGRNRTPDLVSTAGWLKEKGWLDDVGGYSYLSQVYEASGSTANVRYYAETVRDASILRQLAMVGGEIQRLALEHAGSAESLLQEAERQIFALAQMGVNSEAVTLTQAIRESMERLDRRNEQGGGASGITSGFSMLDNLTGGWQKGELILLAARPSVGKTAVSLTLCAAAAQEVSIFFASLEQSRLELTDRLLCAQAGVDQSMLRRGRVGGDEMVKIIDASSTLPGNTFWIDDQAQQSMMRISSTARRIAMRTATGEHPPLGLVVVDYLQLIKPDDTGMPRQEQVSQISKQLKYLARDLNIPVMALAQANRKSEDRAEGKPKLSDLRESGALEADADVVILLHAKDKLAPELNVEVAKNRNGACGEITLLYDRARMRFSESQVVSAF